MRLAITLALTGVLFASGAVRADDEDGTKPGDQSLTCDQISTQVASENTIVNEQGALVAKYDAGTGKSVDNVASVTAMDHAREGIAQHKADAATARGKALVKLGQSKKCFK